MRIALEGRARRATRRAAAGLRAGGAATEDGDRRRPAARRCLRRSAIARSSATIRCRATEKAFAEQVKRARTRLPAVAEGAFRLLAAIAAEHHALTQRIAALPPAQARLAAECRARSATRSSTRASSRATPWAQLAHLPRYLKALDRGSSKLSGKSRPRRPARGRGGRVGGRATANAAERKRNGGALPSPASRHSAGCSRSCGFRCSRRS